MQVSLGRRLAFNRDIKHERIVTVRGVKGTIT
jgi:hypothetical protein